MASFLDPFFNIWTYQQLYCFVLVLVFSALGFSSFVLSQLASLIIIIKSKQSLRRQLPASPTPQSSFYHVSEPDSITVKDSSDKKKLNKDYSEDLESSTPFHVPRHPLEYLSSIFSWLFRLFLLAVLASLSAFDVAPLWFSICMGLTILLQRLSSSFQAQHKRERGSQQTVSSITAWGSMMQNHKIIFIASVSLIVFISFAGPVSTWRSCFNDHVEGYGIPIKGGKIIYSSAFWRYLTLPKVCGDEAPCHVYATVPFDTSSQVFINVHTNPKIESITINYSIKSELSKTVLSQSSSLVSRQNYDWTGDRNIHTVLLTNLTPDQLYDIEIFYNGKTQYKTSYQTLPSENSEKPMTLIYGGDAGHTPPSIAMSKLIGAQKPQAIIIGGDIAYDDGSASCYYSMDLFLWMMEKEIFAKADRLIPMILGVGNHDVGFSAVTNVNMKASKEGPSFFTNFPQSLAEDARGMPINQVPKIEDRKTYKAHMIGGFLNVFLDPSYITKHGGEQAAWLNKISDTYKANPKIAIYHDPIFPPCYSPYPGHNTTEEGLNHWVPVFTEYNYLAVFENHAHAYKRTFPMRGAEKAADGIGTIYFGDGAWGPSEGDSCRFKKEEDSIFETYGGMNHVWLVKIDPTKKEVRFDPIRTDGAVEKGISQNITHFVDL